MNAATKKPALCENLTIKQLLEIGARLEDLGFDEELLQAAMSDGGLLKMGVSSMRSYRKLHAPKPELPIGKTFEFDVPKHLGHRLYNKVPLVEGWYPGRELSLAANTDRTSDLKSRVRGRLLRMNLISFNAPEVVSTVEREGLGSATLEQLLGFALAHPDVSNHCILMAPGTVSPDADGFRWCFPSLRIEYRSGSPERVLSLDLLNSEEIYLLGIVPQD